MSENLEDITGNITKKDRRKRRHMIYFIYEDGHIEEHGGKPSADRALLQPGNMERIKYVIRGIKIEIKQKPVVSF